MIFDDGVDENRRYRSLSHGVPPVVTAEATPEAALARAVALVQEWTNASVHSTTTCVVAPTGALRDNAEEVFRKAGLGTSVIEANKADSAAPAAVRFATMHRAKGLEFDRVLVLAPDRFLGPPAETSDERRLLYVAITRAKRAAALVTF